MEKKMETWCWKDVRKRPNQMLCTDFKKKKWMFSKKSVKVAHITLHKISNMIRFFTRVLGRVTFILQTHKAEIQTSLGSRHASSRSCSTPCPHMRSEHPQLMDSQVSWKQTHRKASIDRSRIPVPPCSALSCFRRESGTCPLVCTRFRMAD